jgi:hypothetical protein
MVEGRRRAYVGDYAANVWKEDDEVEEEKLLRAYAIQNCREAWNRNGLRL